MAIKIVGVSDTHASHWDIKIPDGDILVVAGDFCGYGTMKDVIDFNLWLGTLPHKHKIVAAGNHDKYCVGNTESIRHLFSNAHYLEHEAITLDGIKFFASPWTPAFGDWFFMYERDSERAMALWDAIPNDTNVLITHGPPSGTSLGVVPRMRQQSREDCGCKVLRSKIEKLTNLRVSFHGHIHEGYGIDHVGKVPCLNVSALDGRYNAVNEPMTFLY